MSLDKLLIDYTSLSDIKGNFSKQIEEDQVAPYIREAQTSEIRRFLGDELYLLLLNGYDKDQEPLYFDFLSSDGGWTPWSGGGNVWESGLGWSINFIGLPGIETTITGLAATTFNGFIDINANGNSDGLTVQLLESDGATPIDSDTVSFTASGRQTFTLINPTLQDVYLRIVSDGSGSGTYYLEGVSVDGLLNQEKYNTLMTGEDYTSKRINRTVRFNGLEEALKHWAYYRYLSESDLLSLRFGNRVAEDGVYSTAAFREKVKGAVYHAKNRALMFQADAHEYIMSNLDLYPEYNNRYRIPRTRSFELNKLPNGSNNIFERRGSGWWYNGY